jgi:hypothetical protein
VTAPNDVGGRDSTQDRIDALDFIIDTYENGYQFTREPDGRWVRDCLGRSMMSSITVITVPVIVAELNRRREENGRSGSDG